VIERRADRAEYERACDGSVVVVRLVAATETVDQRLRTRHHESPDALAWHLARQAELDSILDAARVADADVVIGGRTPKEIAADVLQLIGL
jgi:ribose 1,5-bisphosphokinase PhnN